MAGTSAIPSGRGGALWSMAFRPFFLAASLWSAVALGLWVGALTEGMPLPSRFSPLDWHVHEMLFGFIAAAIAGFILTAIPNWTKRAPIHGPALAALFLLWLAGRVACFTSALLPAWAGVAIDCMFLLALAVTIVRELLAAGDRRNLIMPIPITVLFFANLLMHLEALGFGVPTGIGKRLAIAAVIFLISVIGGRIIPAFTRNWLVGRAIKQLPAAAGRLDLLAVAALAIGFLSWVLFPTSPVSSVVLLVAAVLNAWRLARWRGLATTPEPLLAILHAGYLWVVIGTGLLGAHLLWASVPEAAAIHALTAGAMGTMVLAVMTRVSLGHTGRNLRADATTRVAYLAVSLAALTRLAAAFAPSYYLPLIVISAILWIASFLIFVAHYGPMLVASRFDGTES